MQINNTDSDREETIQTTALLRSATILRRVLETWGELLSFSLQWKTNTDVKNSQMSKIIIIIIIIIIISVMIIIISDRQLKKRKSAE